MVPLIGDFDFFKAFVHTLIIEQIKNMKPEEYILSARRETTLLSNHCL